MMRPRRDRQRGTAMVEMAIVLPLLMLLVFGIMEAGWLFAQLTETRNAAREGARLAVVDFGSASDIALETCSRAVLSSDGAVVAIARFGDVANPIDDPAARVTVSIVNSYDSLTGFLDQFFGSSTLDADVTMRVERPLINLNADGGAPCPP